MIIELATLPLEIQKYIAKVEQGESVSFAKNGELIAKIESLAKPVQTQTVYDLIMSQDYPDVSDIELEPFPRQMPPKHRLDILGLPQNSEKIVR